MIIHCYRDQPHDFEKFTISANNNCFRQQRQDIQKISTSTSCRQSRRTVIPNRGVGGDSKQHRMTTTMSLRTSSSSSSSASASSLKMVVIAILAFVWCFTEDSGMIIVTESFQTRTSITTSTTTKTTITNRDHFLMPERRVQLDRSQDPLYLFGRNKEGDNNNDNENGNENTTEKKKKSLPSIPFFGRLKNLTSKNVKKEDAPVSKPPAMVTATATAIEDEPVSKPPATVTATATATATVTATATPPKDNTNTNINNVIKTEKKEPPSPKDYLAMAERARLEAEKLDAELTLSKIEKLEKKLLKSKVVQASVESNSADNKITVDDLQYQLDALQAKLRGEPAPIKTVTTTSSTATPTTTTTQASSSSSKNKFINVDIDDTKVIEVATKLAALDDGDYNIQTEKDLEKIPNFLLKILAAFVGMDAVGIDKKEFLKRWNMTRNLDYSFFTNKTEPLFTLMDIDRKKCEILDSGNTTDLYFTNDNMIVVTKTMLKKADGNATQLALYALECDYYLEMGGNILTSVPIEEITPDFMKNLFVNESYFGSMYPKCVTSRGENAGDDYVSEEPTSAQIDVLTKTILPAIKFSSSAKPSKVPGGWAISGNHKFDNGDELLDAIDKEISKTRPNLMEQITVLYTPSYGPMTNSSIGGESLDSLSIGNMLEEETLEMFAGSEPILYITGPNIVRKPNRLGLTLTSIAGIATSWYLSVYPFLLNDQIASRVDADMKLVEANLQPDLSYLTQYSIPVFLTFIGLQLIHEAAHQLVAISKGVKLSVPVFVPSFITGITSSVTTFKTLPKNKNDMFDISAAGPLAGIVASCIALVIGAKLTLISDPSTLPALPLDILRQSTLGGAIIDNIISGSLFIPEGAPSTGINIPLHPVAIAGYTSLLVNALALLPIGTTDGGRLTLALFDRAEKMSIGTLTLAVLLYSGLFGSDMFLFYFSFCLAFQTGNEVPARNEMDSVDFSRVIVAIICYGLAILTLVPVQS